jgi:hypothetical protein
MAHAQRSAPRAARGKAKRKRANRASPSDALAADKLPDPSEGEAADIAVSKQRVAARHRRLAMKVEAAKDKPTTVTIGPPHSDLHGFGLRAMDAFGTRSGHFVNREIERLTRALSPDGTAAPSNNALNAALAVIDGVKPDNELEAMLAAQMALVHAQSMQALARMNWSSLQSDYELAGNFAVKLTRTFTMQLEALAKLRRGGEQVVKVVHVYANQAVVGDVSLGGGGGKYGKDGQPHEPVDARALAFAPGAPLWSEESRRSAVPSAKGAEQGEVLAPRRSTRERGP